jgi:hypothetical protein
MQGRDASQQTAPIPPIRSTKNWPGATITFGRRCVAPILFDIIQNFPERRWKFPSTIGVSISLKKGLISQSGWANWRTAQG